MKSSITIFVVALVAILGFSSGLDCHDCTYTKLKDKDEVNSACRDDGDGSKVVTCRKPATGKYYHCAKFEGSFDGNDILIRYCLENYMENQDECLESEEQNWDNVKYIGTACVCDEHKCNSATSFLISKMLPILSFVIAFTSILF